MIDLTEQCPCCCSAEHGEHNIRQLITWAVTDSPHLTKYRVRAGLCTSVYPNNQCIGCQRTVNQNICCLKGYDKYMANLLKAVEITIKVIDANKGPKNDHLS